MRSGWNKEPLVLVGPVWHSCPLLDMEIAVAESQQHVALAQKNKALIYKLVDFFPHNINTTLRRWNHRGGTAAFAPLLVTNKQFLSLWTRSLEVALIAKIPVQLLITFPRPPRDEVCGGNFWVAQAQQKIRCFLCLCLGDSLSCSMNNSELWESWGRNQKFHTGFFFFFFL